jgi:hypothetical protein
VRNTKRIMNISLLLIVVLLTACGGQKSPDATPVDPQAVFTAAAQTVSAELTQTASAITPTSEATATFTPEPPTPTQSAIESPTLGSQPVELTPIAGIPSPTQSLSLGTPSGPLCDGAEFVADMTIPDGTIMKPGEDFKKIWRIKNTGICKWDEGYQLAFAGGDPLDGQPFLFKNKSDFVDPGQSADIGIKMTAHLKEGDYSGCWRMLNDRGYFFGGIVCVSIKVQK